MAYLRKWFVALAVVAIPLSLGTAPANAQAANPAFVCNANAGVPPLVRSEGITELVGDLILNCTGGNPTAKNGPVPLSNVQIFLNTNVTSRIVGSGSLSEATLMIDEPLPQLATRVPDNTVFVPQGPPPPQVVCTPQGNPCPIVGDGLGTPYETIPGTPTVYSGRQAAVGSVSWNGVPIDAPGITHTRVIRITNVRANACQLGTSSTLIPTQIVMFISVTGSQQVTINNPQQTVAFIQPGMIVSVAPGTGQQCVSQNIPLISSTTTSLSNNGMNFAITVREGFASSFKRRNIALTPDGTTVPAPRAQNIPGYPYNTESGFYNPALFTATPGVGLEDFGTRIRIAFNNIGAGVRVFVPTTVTLATPPGNPSTPQQPPSPVAAGIATGRLQLVQADQFGNSAPGFTAVSATGVSAGIPVAEVTSVNGVNGPSYAVYEVVNSDVNALESASIPVAVAFIGNPGQNLPAQGKITANISFAPAGGPTAGIQTADANAPIPRFCGNLTLHDVFTINPCTPATPTCNLLFPYVSNQAGFNTIIAIANTSLGPPFSASSQEGKVALYYFGGTQGNGDAPKQTTSLGTGTKAGIVPAGCELVFTLSSGGAVTNCLGLTTDQSTTTIAAKPGFQGFIIAVANFPNCQGFAFIADQGLLHVAEGYLAIPLSLVTPLDRTGVFGENKGH